MLEELKLQLKHIILYFLSLNCCVLTAQGDFFIKGDTSEKINFELINNLILIPLEINDVSLTFILDTGVSRPILFNLSEQDSLYLKNTKMFYLHGLGGDGKIEALKSSYNRFEIGGAVGVNQDLYVVFDENINFTPRLGVLVHGIIGYDIFKNFVVEINYSSKYIRLHKLNSFKPKSSKKWKTIPINIHRMKPYVDAKVTIDEVEKPVKLLIDTGSSDALWLFEDLDKKLTLNTDLFFTDYLGKGLSGSVYGKRSKAKNFILGDFSLKDVNVAFPDSLSIDLSKVYKERNGSLGGDILKRFNFFFDYSNEKIYIKKNRFFKDLFTYNNSGIVIEYNGIMFVKEEINVPFSNGYSDESEGFQNNKAVRIDLSIKYIMSLKPAYKIVEIRKSSNAYASGLRVGDILININSKPSYGYGLSEIYEILHGKTGKSIWLKIERDGKSMIFKFKLDDAFKKNEPSN